jgi:hypothetical protein
MGTDIIIFISTWFPDASLMKVSPLCACMGNSIYIYDNYISENFVALRQLNTSYSVLANTLIACIDRSPIPISTKQSNIFLIFYLGFPSG